MQQLLFLLALLFLPFMSRAQQDTVFIRYNNGSDRDTLTYTTDTVLFESEMRRHLLTGTTVLPSTFNQQAAKEYGIYFDKVTKSDCERDVTEYGGTINDHINSITATDSTLIIDMNIYSNCCFSFLCDISVDNKGILQLTYNGYGTYCSCDCCFGLVYHLSLLKGKDIPEIKGVMINNNRKTTKKIPAQ